MLKCPELGLEVWFDYQNTVQVIISGDYAEQVCGLCGNFDHSTANDFIQLDGTLVSAKLSCLIDIINT